MKSLPARVALVALPLWLLWAVLIVAGGATQPAPAAKIAFGVSTLAAFFGCCWAMWHSLDAHAGKLWRRPATLVLAGGLFVAIVVVGHFIGVAIALRPGPG